MESKIVRFATLCTCGARSPEYTQWPICNSCGEYTCPKDEVPGTRTDADVDAPETNLCKACRSNIDAQEADNDRF
jgi:hypothetical protein